MKKSKKKFVLAGLVLLAITMVLLPLSGCKNDSVPETPKYEVTFDVGGNREATAPKPITVESGTELTAEQVPELSDTSSYQFMGWYLGDTEIKAGYTVTEPVTVTARWQGWLTFTAEGEQSLIIEGLGDMQIPDSMEYSTDGSIWDKPEVDIPIPFGNGTKLYLRAKSSIGTAENFNAHLSFEFGTEVKVACSGDIRTLVDYTNPTGADTSKARFCYLFAACSQLTQAPELPATTLADFCYFNMFRGCTGLTQAPELPATILVDFCYYAMFSNCTGLTQAPELPAKALADDCYSYMFSDCTSLAQAPELPAETLTDSCYSYMFRGCISLTEAPELPATNLADSCYMFMFSRCTSLTQAPKLSAETLASSCYSNMFFGCTGLTEAPKLSATTLADDCYFYMFNGCENLSSVTMLATDVSASDALNGWLKNTAVRGTLYVASGMEANETIEGSLPTGWTVEVAATN